MRSPTQTTPPILIGRLHSYDFRSNCIVNHDLTLSSRLHVIQHFETICTNWYYHKPTRFRQPNNSKSKYPQQNQSSFAFAVMYLVLPWGFWFCCEVFQCFCRDVFGFAVTFLVLLWQLWATIQNRPFTASHSRGTKQPRWRAKVAQWQGICTTWMSSCKGPNWVCTGLYGW